MKTVAFTRIQGNNLLHWKTWLDMPRYIILDVRDFFLRGLCGYAPSDLWSLDRYLCEWMPYALRDLKNTPVDHAYSGMDIDLMIKGFELAQRDNDYLFDEKTEHLRSNWKELEEQREKERKEAMYHFVDHFNGLWW